MIVGCETKDGLIITHSEDSTCEVCSTQPDAKCEVPKPPKHKHSPWAGLGEPYSAVCPCGARRCGFSDPQINGGELCSGIARKSGYCLKHSKPQSFWSVDRINDILSNPDKTTTLESGKIVNNSMLIYRFLMRMFERQTVDEQASFSTNKQNGVGFTGADAAFMTDRAVNAKKWNDEYQMKYNRININGLTVPQAKVIAGRLRKYLRGQLIDIANESTDSMPETVVAVQQAVRTSEPHEPVAMTAMLEAKKADNPTAYFDPFDEGEPMSEQAARDFWKKRFESHPYRGKQ